MLTKIFFACCSIVGVALLPPLWVIDKIINKEKKSTK